MKIRKCPCCDEKISLKDFFKEILFTKKYISFVEKEKGLICQKCNKSILSAERKASIGIFILPISMIPLMIIGFDNDASSLQDHILNFSIGFLLSFILLLTMLYRKYNNVDFICKDESSDEFESYSIHG